MVIPLLAEIYKKHNIQFIIISTDYNVLQSTELPQATLKNIIEGVNIYTNALSEQH